jgi:hypothetical protein
MARYTQIEPITIPTKGIGQYITIDAQSFALGADAVNLHWRILENVELNSMPPLEGKELLNGTLLMANSDLANWGADDNVAIDWVINELNLTKK